MKRISFIFLAVLLLAGCAGIDERKTQVDLTDFSNYLNQQKHVLTYSQAVREWGPPKRTTQSIGFFVATWLGEIQFPSVLSSNTPTGEVQVIQVRNLQLAFDKETQKMVHWKYGE